MAIPFKCPTCGATGKAGSKLIGSVMPCPKCGSLVQIDEVFPTAPPDLTPPVAIEDPEQAWGRSTARLPPEPVELPLRVVPRKSTLAMRPIILAAFSLVTLIVGGAIGMSQPNSTVAEPLCIMGFVGLLGGLSWLSKLGDADVKAPPTKPLTDREIMEQLLATNKLATDRLGCLLWLLVVSAIFSALAALQASR